MEQQGMSPQCRHLQKQLGVHEESHVQKHRPIPPL